VTVHDEGGVRGRLVLRQLRKVYGDVRAVDDISIDARPGEFITFLGPSGSGKTTTLKMIAGFSEPDGGTIELDGRPLVGVPPYRRDIGMVFQNYALFPHMTAAENIAFPLRMRDVGRTEIRDRVEQSLALVKLERLGGRYPRQLSGGQQQRIALARAVVFRPRLLLMDEPLGALDKKLREALQLEIMGISRQLRTTVVYVTHDQEEALVMSDRIAIYNHGRIEQIGSGEDLYERPSSLFVADFIGQSNIIRGRLVVEGGAAWLRTPTFRARVAVGAFERAGLRDGAAAALVVRPERLRVAPPGGSTDRSSPADASGLAIGGATANVTEVIYLGSDRKYALRLGDGTALVARRQADQADPGLVAGGQASIDWRIEDAVLLPDEPPEELARDEAGDVLRPVEESGAGPLRSGVGATTHRE